MFEMKSFRQRSKLYMLLVMTFPDTGCTTVSTAKFPFVIGSTVLCSLYAYLHISMNLLLKCIQMNYNILGTKRIYFRQPYQLKDYKNEGQQCYSCDRKREGVRITSNLKQN